MILVRILISHRTALAVVRRPEKQRWFAILDHYWLETRLLEVASPTSQYGIDWYCVEDKAAKSALRSYIKDCRGPTMLSF